MTKLFESFTRVGIVPGDLPAAEKLLGNLGERMADFRMMLDMIKATFAGEFKLSAKAMAIIGGAVLYVISPVDAIPDFLPIIGWTDDIAVIGLALKMVSDEIERYKSWKAAA